MDNLIDYSSKNIQALPIKLSTFFEAEKKLINYNQCVVLYGIRRTGKTTVLNQLWIQYKTDLSRYIYISDNCDIDELISYLEKYEIIDILLIDEITRIYGIESKIHVLLDYCFNLGIKLVIAGTDSYMLNIAMNDSAFGRFNLVRFTPIRFTDLIKIYPSITFKDFYNFGKTFVNDDVILSLSENIMSSVEKAYSLNKSVLTVMRFDDIMLAIKMILEYLIGVKSFKLPSTKLVFSKRYYDIENNISELMGDLPKSSVNLIFSIMENLDIVGFLYEYEVDIEEPLRCDFYVTMPSLYKDLLKEYNITSTQIKSDKLGYVFESAAITQIKSELQKRDNFNYYKLFTLRSETLGYEIDLCVENCFTNELYLLEFKLSGTKYGKHFYNGYVQDFIKSFSKVHYYTVTASELENENNLIKQSLFYDNMSLENKDSIKKISIMNFLNKIDEYIK